jgi:hypothetical protein
MINIRVSPASSQRLYAEIENKIEGIKELKSVRSKNEIMSAEFSMSAIKFIKRTNLLARSAKKSFHHVYEWGGAGNESSRLFRIIKKQEAGGNASIYYKFNNSKKNAPIAPALTIPGRTGRRVTKSGVFKRKAEIMESGKEINFTTSRYIAFSPRSGGVVFVPPGKTISIKNPGGKQTTGSFEKHFRAWWTVNFGNSLDQAGVFKKLEKNVARALTKKGSDKNSARAAIQSTLSPYQTIGSVI